MVKLNNAKDAATALTVIRGHSTDEVIAAILARPALGDKRTRLVLGALHARHSSKVAARA